MRKHLFNTSHLFSLDFVSFSLFCVFFLLVYDISFSVCLTHPSCVFTAPCQFHASPLSPSPSRWREELEKPLERKSRRRELLQLSPVKITTLDTGDCVLTFMTLLNLRRHRCSSRFYKWRSLTRCEQHIKCIQYPPDDLRHIMSRRYCTFYDQGQILVSEKENVHMKMDMIPESCRLHALAVAVDPDLWPLCRGSSMRGCPPVDQQG